MSDTITYAFYKGRKAENSKARVFDQLVCSWPRTRGRFSHGEQIAPNGMGLSSSFRDGGVRSKAIDWHSGRWVLVTVPATRQEIGGSVEYFMANMGRPYDWISLFGFVLPWRVSYRRWIFCTEALAAARGLRRPWEWDPNRLFEHLASLPGAVVTEPGGAAPQ